MFIKSKTSHFIHVPKQRKLLSLRVLFIMSCSRSIYEDRLNRLVHGYNKRIMDIPNDISYCIIDFIFCSNDKNVIFQQVNNGNNNGIMCVEMEIFMDSFMAKVMNYSRIKQYIIEYKYESIFENLFKNNHNMIQTITTKRIYEDGISFINVPVSMEYRSSLQATAMDYDDNSVIKSEWIDIPFINYYLPYIVPRNTETTANTYFDQHIDLNNKSSIGITEWISAFMKMKEMQQFTELELKRIFYYIIEYYASKKSVKSHQVQEVTASDFHDFITCQDYDVLKHYSDPYKKFMNIIRRRIPGLMRC